MLFNRRPKTGISTLQGETDKLRQQRDDEVRNTRGLTVAEIGLLLILGIVLTGVVFSVTYALRLCGDAAQYFVNGSALDGDLPLGALAIAIIGCVIYLVRPWQLFRREETGPAVFATDYAAMTASEDEVEKARKQKILTYILLALTLLLTGLTIFNILNHKLPTVNAKTACWATLLQHTGPTPKSPTPTPTPKVTTPAPSPRTDPSDAAG